MNKRQKEVIQSNLDAEKAVLKQLERHYRSALNDIDLKLRIMQSDELTVSRLYRIEHQKALKAQVEAILEKLHSDEYTTISQFLNEAYTDAFVGTAYDMFGQGVPLILPIDPKEAVKAIQTDSKISEDLYTALGVDTEKLKTSVASEITRGLASDMAYDDIARNIRNASKVPLSRAKTIVATEAHRIQEASTYDAQKKAKSKGADIVRQWNSTMDGNTRPTHRHLDGQIREMDEPFEMDGKTAMYPGDFGDPAEDCNCRCVTLQRARWALGESELETLKQRAEFFGLDKTENFADFKEKYLKAVENTGKSGIIKAKTLEEADEFLKSIGIEGGYARGKINLDVANLINQEVANLKSVFGDALKVRSIKKWPKRDAAFVAAYSPAFGDVFLYDVSNKTAIKRIAADTAAEFAAGAWSTGDIAHFIRHELGHAVHSGVGRDKTQDALAKLFDEATANIEWGKHGHSYSEYVKAGLTREKFVEDIGEAGKVLSAYGLTSVKEMVAESVAEYMAGKPRKLASQVVDILMKG